VLVYGDRARTVDPRRVLARLSGIPARAPHDQLVGGLILAGELAQGLADAEFEAAGQDDLSEIQGAAMELAICAARRLFATRSTDGVPAAIARLRSLRLPPTIRCKTPEGYAFYAVYPEAYAVAGAGHDWGGRPLAIGLRSIGTSLAAAVAAATGGEALSLRPTGPPFRRRIEASDRLWARLDAHPGPFAIVDEGPGLSGSSFGCVAELLEDLGVSGDRMVFMPSHGGDVGPEASPRDRARWAGARRLVRTFDDLAARDPLPGWFEAEIGPTVRLDDLSAGGWRRTWPKPPTPPSAPAMERRKFRLWTATGTYLARSAGLGEHGEAKLERARVLHQAGFGPEPLALRRGFLLERWIEGALLKRRDRPSDFLRQLGDYLDLRRRSFPAAGEAGADPGLLRQMALNNADRLAGPCVAEGLEPLLARLGGSGSLQPVHIDGRMHPWEWRVVPGGFCKLDALDHSCGHDLVGAQDILWDVAGAIVELGLDDTQSGDLTRRLDVDPEQLAPMAACYAAFQGGLWSISTVQNGGSAGARRRAAFYRGQLRRMVDPD
jgi:hypothetical protein